jgi:hypothetical protein
MQARLQTLIADIRYFRLAISWASPAHHMQAGVNS